MSKQHHSSKRSIRQFWRTLGPGLITGASDDDPSAITTFSQAGARYGLATLWMAILAYPILAVLQEMCARIGIVTGKGLTDLVRSYYPKWVLYLLVGLSCPAFLLNIGADIALFGETGHLLFHFAPPLYCSVVFTLLLFILMLFLPYKKLMGFMKLLCLVLLVYLVVPFLTPQDPKLIIRHSLIPTFEMDKNFLLIVVGLTGAIISPYIFFWQISSEADTIAVEASIKKINKISFLLMRKDILAGALFAVLIMYYVILTTGTILHDQHINAIHTAQDAAIALRPLAGPLSYILFSIGIIGTGFLIIPILSSSISYIVTEAFNHKSGLNKSPEEVKLFYVIIAIALCLGVSMHWLGISPVKALLLTTILNGFITPFLLFIILHISNNKKIMGPFCNKRFSNLVGIVALCLMLASLVFLGSIVIFKR